MNVTINLDLDANLDAKILSNPINKIAFESNATTTSSPATNNNKKKNMKHCNSVKQYIIKNAQIILNDGVRLRNSY